MAVALTNPPWIPVSHTIHKQNPEALPMLEIRSIITRVRDTEKHTRVRWDILVKNSSVNESYFLYPSSHVISTPREWLHTNFLLELNAVIQFLYRLSVCRKVDRSSPVCIWEQTILISINLHDMCLKFPLSTITSAIYEIHPAKHSKGWVFVYIKRSAIGNPLLLTPIRVIIVRFFVTNIYWQGPI